MSEQVVVKTLTDLLLGINVLIATPYHLPALLLLYTSMDIVASLTRPVTEDDTSGPVFKKWVDDYMLPSSGLPCNSDDIWAARCGLLHTHSVESRKSREGKARRIQYSSNPNAVAAFQQKVDPTANTDVVVHFGAFATAFLDGITAFIKKISSDQQLQAVVYHHAKKLAVQGSFSMPSTDPKQRGKT